MNYFIKIMEYCPEYEFVKNCDKSCHIQGGGGPVRLSSFQHYHVPPFLVYCLSHQYLIFSSYASALCCC